MPSSHTFSKHFSPSAFIETLSAFYIGFVLFNFYNVVKSAFAKAIESLMPDFFLLQTLKLTKERLITLSTREHF